ncbi:hypothetical protein, partial [Micromonospora sp. DT47]|uniref:hypothetical protein n=1 Tax=Micromonospora sp. DT47 TaxID=3393431 RepID=UPI003CECB814
LLAELADCLVEPPVLEWPFYGGSIADVAASGLGGVTVDSVPWLAEYLLERMRVPSPGRCDLLALRLLLGLAFPEGPLPDGVSFADLSASQQEVVRLVLQAGLLRQGPMMPRGRGVQPALHGGGR